MGIFPGRDLRWQPAVLDQSLGLVDPEAIVSEGFGRFKPCPGTAAFPRLFV